MELMILAVIAFVFGGIWCAIFGRNWRKDDIIEIVTNAFTGSDTSTFVNTSEGISW